MININLLLPKLIQGAVILLAVMAVAVADVMLKRASAHGNLLTALRSQPPSTTLAPALALVASAGVMGAHALRFISARLPRRVN